MRCLIAICIFCLLFNSLQAAWQSADSLQQGNIVPTTDTIATKLYLQDPQFNYVEEKAPPHNWWTRFWSYVWFLLEELWAAVVAGSASGWAIRLITLGILLFFVYKLIYSSKQSVFSKKDNSVQFTIGEEAIAQFNFSAAIQKAETAELWEEAFRLNYLAILKLLNEKQLITLSKNKTNNHYLTEMNRHEEYAVFLQITRNFEWIWYGNKPLTNEVYFQYKQLVQQFQQSVA
ncbi:MAG: hypothetical protein ACOVQE_05870 [Chitinophagaceae bacterium]